MTKILDDVLRLSVSERILMVEAIWDSIAKSDEHLELSVETRQMLDERLENHRNHPHVGSDWNEVKARIKHKSDA
jgi:putative addiction module component (TIGR02574 family)